MSKREDRVFFLCVCVFFFLELNVKIEEFSDNTKRNVIFGVCVTHFA